MQVVCCAVERIDDPDGVGFAARAGFLGQDGVVRIMLVNGLDDRALGVQIGVTDVIVAALSASCRRDERPSRPH
jgi:hypothetical protein